jgi:alpha-L-fucosidase
MHLLLRLRIAAVVGCCCCCCCCPAAVAASGTTTGSTASAAAAAAATAAGSSRLALPSAKQLEFQERHPIGCFFHFGINTFTGQEHGSGDAKQPPQKFDAPASLDTDQWVQTCAALGGTYAVFTAKHEEGMMNWPSNATNYSIASSPFCAARKKAGRSCDLVAEFLASCDRYNLTRGLYYTISNSHCRTVANGGAPTPNTTCDQMLRNAFTELATSYGPIGQFWFDHGDNSTPAYVDIFLYSLIFVDHMIYIL